MNKILASMSVLVIVGLLMGGPAVQAQGIQTAQLLNAEIEAGRANTAQRLEILPVQERIAENVPTIIRDISEPTKERLLNQLPQRFGDVEQKLREAGLSTHTALIWTHDGKQYAEMHFTVEDHQEKGYFTAVVKNLADPTIEDMKMWGIYGNGVWAGFVDTDGTGKVSIDKLVYGKYQDLEQYKPYTAWVLYNFVNEAQVWGFGLHTFSV